MQTEREESGVEPSDDDEREETAGERGRKAKEEDKESAADTQRKREEDARQEAERKEREKASEESRKLPEGTIREPPRTEEEKKKAQEEIDRNIARESASSQEGTTNIAQIEEYVRLVKNQQIRVEGEHQFITGVKSPVRHAISLMEPLSNAYTQAYWPAFEAELRVILKGKGSNEATVEDKKRAHEMAHEVAKENVRELIEDLLRAQEEDDAEVRQEDQQQLRGAINTVIGDAEFRDELATYVQGRNLAHMGSWTSKYVGPEGVAQVTTGFNTFHIKSLLNTPGVVKALELLEEPDDYGVKGAYYRKFESEELDPNDDYIQIAKNSAERDKRDTKDADFKQELWVTNMRFKLVKAAREELAKASGDEKKTSIYIKHLPEFTEKDDTLIKATLFTLQMRNKLKDKPNTPAQAVDEIIKNEPDLAEAGGLIKREGGKIISVEDRIKNFKWFIYQIQRSFQVGERIHHTFGMSAMWDGPRWKEGTVIPEKYWSKAMRDEFERTGKRPVAGDNQLVEIHPKVTITFGDEPEDAKEFPKFLGETVEDLDFLTAADADKDSIEYAAWKKYRRVKKHIAEDVTREWRNFYADEYNWNHIDFDKSAKNSGRGARQLSRLMNYPLILMHETEAHPGREWLRRYAYLNVPSLMQMTGFTGAEQLINSWMDEYNYMKEGWANSRLAEAPKFKKALTEDKPKLIKSTNTLKDFVKSLVEVKPLIEAYTTEKEAGEVVEHWVKGLLEFRRNHSQEADLLNLGDAEIERQIDYANAQGLITTEKNENIRRDMLMPKWLKNLEQYRPLSHDQFPGALIWKTYEQLDSVRKFFRDMAWIPGIFTGLWEFIKQLFVIPK